MTFDCYKFAIFEEFRGISQISEAITAKQMKIDPNCQRQRWNPLNVLFNIVFLALICRTFLR